MKLQELFKTKKSWTKGVSAKTKEGKRVTSRHLEAVSWCLIGGIYKCYDDPIKIRSRVLDYIERKYNYYSIAEWNDAKRRTFKDVKELIKELDI